MTGRDDDEFRDAFGIDPKPKRSFVERVSPERTAEAVGRAWKDDEPAETGVDKPSGEVIVGSGDYHAYGYMPGGATDCDIQSWMPLRPDIPEGVCFDYRLLLHIGYGGLEVDSEASDATTGKMYLRLFLPECVIHIEGAHLHDLKSRLRRREISFIQEYSSMVFGEPASKLPAGEPVITKIIIGHYEDGPDARKRH